MQHDFTWLRLELLRRLASEAGYPEDLARQAFDVFFRARNEVVLYDDVLPALTTLSARCRLFALSNGNADLAAIGLSHFFERSLCAREAGCLKPDPRIFRRLLDDGGRVPVVAGCSAQTAAETLAKIRQAADAGCAIAMVSPPWYVMPGPDEILAHREPVEGEIAREEARDESAEGHPERERKREQCGGSPCHGQHGFAALFVRYADHLDIADLWM